MAILKMLRIIRSEVFSELDSNKIEKIMFDNDHYIEESAFSTGHQLVNVYGMPERRYEVRSEESALDVQVHGQSRFVQIDVEDIESNKDEEYPRKNNEAAKQPTINMKLQNRPQPSAGPEPKSNTVVETASNEVKPTPKPINKMSAVEYRKQFPVGCTVSYPELGRGTVVMNRDNLFVVDFDKYGKKPVDISSCMQFGLLTRE